MGQELNQDAASHGLTEEDIIHIPGLHSRWVRLANGAKAHYVTSGETGPAVILLHGGIIGSSGTAGWRFMAPFLGANGFRVFAPDQPGFGWADTREEYLPYYGVKSHIQFINDFADALCLEKFHISGNSMGCANAINYIVNYPERIISFALIAGGAQGITDPAKQVSAQDSKYHPNPGYVRPAWDGKEETMAEIMNAIIYKPTQIWPELVTMRTKAALRQTAAFAAYSAGRQTLAEPSLNQWAQVGDRLSKITIPGIYMYGLQDVVIAVENGFNQEDVLPNIQFFYPDECGHQGQTDQPEMFNQAFLEFFRDGKVSRKTADWAGVSKRRPEIAGLVAQT